jgi:fructokinase
VVLVLVSLGSEGAFYATRDFSGTAPAYEVEVVDATGAGDAFLAAALVHLSQGSLADEESVREAARRGNAAGALACTGFGAMTALPTREALKEFMEKR